MLCHSQQIRKKDSTSNFFLKSNKWISAGMGSKLMFVSLGILLIPCVIVTGTYPAVRNTKGTQSAALRRGAARRAFPLPPLSKAIADFVCFCLRRRLLLTSQATGE